MGLLACSSKSLVKKLHFSLLFDFAVQKGRKNNPNFSVEIEKSRNDLHLGCSASEFG